MGRTLDGGYYLIGMRGFHDVLMRRTDEHHLRRRRPARGPGRICGLRLAELPVTFDIDEEATWSISARRSPPMARPHPRPGRRCGAWGYMKAESALTANSRRSPLSIAAHSRN